MHISLHASLSSKPYGWEVTTVWVFTNPPLLTYTDVIHYDYCTTSGTIQYYPIDFASKLKLRHWHGYEMALCPLKLTCHGLFASCTSPDKNLCCHCPSQCVYIYTFMCGGNNFPSSCSKFCVHILCIYAHSWLSVTMCFVLAHSWLSPRTLYLPIAGCPKKHTVVCNCDNKSFFLCSSSLCIHVYTYCSLIPTPPCPASATFRTASDESWEWRTGNKAILTVCCRAFSVLICTCSFWIWWQACMHD